MNYYVWLEYYTPAPVHKKVSSRELKYADKHSHGVKPTQRQIDTLQPSLEVEVGQAYEQYNRRHNTHLAPPASAVIKAGRRVETRSSRS